jgi:hypothetical protein
MRRGGHPLLRGQYVHGRMLRYAGHEVRRRGLPAVRDERGVVLSVGPALRDELSKQHHDVQIGLREVIEKRSQEAYGPAW